MALNIRFWIGLVWLSVGIVWAIWALRLKPIARSQSTVSRLGEIIPLVLAAWLLFSSQRGPAIINIRVLPWNSVVQFTGLFLTFAGSVVAIYARVFLGANWSGRASIKQGHELIRTGPYSVVRHPIYSGLLLSVAGTAIAFGELRHLLAILSCSLAGG
jgi:protein-S-isoprenylcysteine O-methyltransferase Ste14